MGNKGSGGKPRKKAADNYITKGAAGEWKREDTRGWYLAENIIRGIGADFDIYDGYGLTEKEQAEAIVARCGRWIKHCEAIGWLVYNPDSGCWRTEYAEAAVREVIGHFGKLRRDGAYPENRSETTFARSVLSDHGINAVLHIMKDHVNISKEIGEFDADGDVLNCRGELVDLRDGSRRAAVPEDYITKSTRYKPGPAYTGKREEAWPVRFMEFLGQITGKEGEARPDLANWIMTWFGYGLSGDTSAQFFVNFHGRGRNGKSVLLSLMYEIFGDYATSMPEDLVIENYGGSGFDMADLPGVRLAALMDASEGRLNMKALKPIVSGDTIRARRKFKDNFDLRPVCKVVVCSNPRLTLKETGLAVQRRVRMVPFDYTVPEDRINPHLKEEMLEEGEMITALLIRCAVEYYKSGRGPGAFPACAAVDEASREYVKGEDQVGEFLEEETEADDGGMVKAQDLYARYVEWAAARGNKKPMMMKRFGDRLAMTDVKKERRGDGVWYTGIRFKGTFTEARPTVQPTE